MDDSNEWAFAGRAWLDTVLDLLFHVPHGSWETFFNFNPGDQDYWTPLQQTLHTPYCGVSLEYLLKKLKDHETYGRFTPRAPRDEDEFSIVLATFGGRSALYAVETRWEDVPLILNALQLPDPRKNLRDALYILTHEGLGHEYADLILQMTKTIARMEE